MTADEIDSFVEFVAAQEIDSLMEYVTLRILHLEADLAVAEVTRDAALYEQTRGAVRELQQMVNEWVKPRMGAAL